MILERINLLSQQIQYLDTYLKKQTVEDPYFRFLLGLPGVGKRRVCLLILTGYFEKRWQEDQMHELGISLLPR